MISRAMGCFAVVLCLGAVGRPQAAKAEEMVEVGGHRMEIIRGGGGGPTVVFEAGLDSDIGTWKRFVPMVGTGAVAYSRAGHGKSDPVSGPRTPAQIVSELHLLLEHAGYKPPYVLVGQSAGALYARAFTITYPAEVSGLVLVDGTPDRWEFEKMKAAEAKNIDYGTWPPAGDPHWDAATKAEFTGMLPIVTTDQKDVMGKLPDVPTAIITSLNPNGLTYGREIKALSRKLHSEEFASTTYGMHIVTSKSGHGIPSDEPYLVLSAIRWVVEAARMRK